MLPWRSPPNSERSSGIHSIPTTQSRSHSPCEHPALMFQGRTTERSPERIPEETPGHDGRGGVSLLQVFSVAHPSAPSSRKPSAL